MSKKWDAIRGSAEFYVTINISTLQRSEAPKY